jgi:hypothetical protein
VLEQFGHYFLIPLLHLSEPRIVNVLEDFLETIFVIICIFGGLGHHHRYGLFELVLCFLVHPCKLEHVNETLECLDDTLPVRLVDVVLGNHDHKLDLPHTLEKTLQEVGNSDGSHVVETRLEASHIDQTYLFLAVKAGVNVGVHRD